MPSELSLELIATDNLNQTVEVLINGTRYVYQFEDGFELMLFDFRKAMKHSKGQALGILKRRSKSYQKIGETS